MVYLRTMGRPVSRLFSNSSKYSILFCLGLRDLMASPLCSGWRTTMWQTTRPGSQGDHHVLTSADKWHALYPQRLWPGLAPVFQNIPQVHRYPGPRHWGHHHWLLLVRGKGQKSCQVSNFVNILQTFLITPRTVSRSVTSSRMTWVLWSQWALVGPALSSATCPSSSPRAPRSTWRSSGPPGSTPSPSGPLPPRLRGGTSWTEGQGKPRPPQRKLISNPNCILLPATQPSLA